MGPIYTLADFLDMLRRRMGLVSAVLIVGVIGSVRWALSVPHVYESSEVIQIEQPVVSDELARSTVESSAARRLQLIEQQLMARSNLVKMIEEFGLYDDLPALRPSEQVDLLRQSISITGVAAAREGFADDGAISVLTITATMGDPEKAQRVAHTLAEMTRSLATSQRLEQTRETLAFFQQQEDSLLAKIAELDAELSQYRRANDLSIEGSLEFRRTELTSLNDAILALDREIITNQLARQNIDRSGNTRAATVQREEEALDREMTSLSKQRQLLQDRRSSLSASIEKTPEVERTLAEFDRRMTQLQDQLELVAARRNEAAVAVSLESNERGETFTTLEEAQLPDYPISMSRKLRVAMGSVAAGLLALGLAFIMELRRPVIRTAAQMQRETGLLPVVSIPDTATKHKSGKGSQGWKDQTKASLQGRQARLERSLNIEQQ
jgi:uncharacterized protein involved in exopolysaccharide biosynthesis